MAIRSEFDSNTLSPSKIERIDDVKKAFSIALDAVEALVPVSRERSIVVTKLQEACMFAVRGIAVAATPPVGREGI